MVNKSMSNPGIRLANSGAKLLQTNNQNRGMVGPGGLEPTTRPLSAACCSPNSRQVPGSVAHKHGIEDDRRKDWHSAAIAREPSLCAPCSTWKRPDPQLATCEQRAPSAGAPIERAPLAVLAERAAATASNSTMILGSAPGSTAMNVVTHFLPVMMGCDP
jgi:hypothetical protein